MDFVTTFGIFGLLLTFLITILWLIIGWRAMKAHEAIATEAKKYNERLQLGDLAKANQELTETKRSLVGQKKLYAKFLRENPAAAELSSKERHLKFRDWLEDPT